MTRLVRRREAGVLAALVAVAAIAATVALAKRGGADDFRCPAGAVRIDTAIPQPSDVLVRVSGADRAAAVGQLRAHRFQASEAGAEASTAPGKATLRYGPRTVAAAWLLRAYLPEVEPVYDPHRADGAVDVALGSGYRVVRSTSEANRALAAQGPVWPPEGTCG